jgi:cytochrome c-type biogenesis protein CcmE
MMHPKRKQRMLVVIFIVVFASIAIGLMAYALRGNINLYYPPAAIAAGEAPVGQGIRAGGMVVDNSVKRSGEGLDVRFQVTDYKAVLEVVYSGILPDLFDEGEGVVVAGELDEEGVLHATEVLAKHDENYMPPEVAESLAESPSDKKPPAYSGTVSE